MKLLIKKIAIFFTPFFIVFCTFISLDVFKIFKSHDNYNDTFLTLNRGFVCQRTYLKHRNIEKFDSFILGSSLSLVFKNKKWEEYLPSNSKTFHFDASGDGIYGVYHKLKYIDELGDNIKNALIILDRRSLTVIEDGNNHFTISPPEISGKSKFNFYKTFIKKNFDVKFMIAYIDFSIFKTHRNYMGFFIRKSKYKDYSDTVNCDFTHGYDVQIDKDSLGYYNKLINNGVFYDRPKKNFLIRDKFTNKEKNFLLGIKEILKKNKTKYKIVISPTYDQIPIENGRLHFLNILFGADNIFNFSGVNQLTESVHNYYESDHFRPHVANFIIDSIYKTGVSKN